MLSISPGPVALPVTPSLPRLPTALVYDAHGRQVDAHFGVLNAAALDSRRRQLRTAR